MFEFFEKVLKHVIEQAQLNDSNNDKIFQKPLGL